MFETFLRLDSTQYMEEVERIGGYHSETHVRPIRVKVQTRDQRNHILCLAHNLHERPQDREFRSFYIQPFLSPDHMKRIRKELCDQLKEFKKEGYYVKKWRYNIVRNGYGKPNEILYTPAEFKDVNPCPWP